MPTEALVDHIVDRSKDWGRQYEQEYGERNREYYRAWRGIWDTTAKNYDAERSRVIMPSTSQAIDSAVSDVIEALFSREDWLSTGDLMLDDLLLQDLWRDRPNIEEAILYGALYGNIISKIHIGLKNNRPILSTQALSLNEIRYDPSANSFEESSAIVQDIFVPKHIVEMRMKAEDYRSVALESSPDFIPRNPGEARPRNSDYVQITEWWGLVPFEEVEARQKTDQLRDERIGEDGLVEAVCTIANNEVVLRCEANPYGQDRPFVSAQWHTVPRRIPGRGVAEMAYWPQKALDAEMRARIDSLAYSTVPMMVLNSRLINRGERFLARPGGKLFARGSPRDAAAPLQFSGPDPGSYQQSLELQRMIEMGTGQFTNASPLSDISRTGTGPLSAVLGASVKRSARTLLNIERDYVLPLIEKSARRLHDMAPDLYPKLEARPKINSGVGIMLRELENQQLAQLMQQIPDASAQLAMLSMIVEGSSIRGEEKKKVLAIVDEIIERSMAPDQMTPDQELQMALLQEQQAAREQKNRETLAELRIKQENAETERIRVTNEHEQRMLEIGIKAAEADAKTEQSIARREYEQSNSETGLILP